MRRETMTKSRSSSSSGFTLVELMITVLVIAILTAIGLPSYSAIIRSNLIATQSNGFLAAVNLARTEAIKNNYQAGICASSDGQACNTTNWGLGYLVFDDTNNDGALSAGETIVRYSSGSPNISFVTTPAGGPGVLIFDPRGEYMNANQLVLTLQPNDCPSGYLGTRTMTLHTVGQVTMTKNNCP